MADTTDQRLNDLKQKYASVLNSIQQKGVRLSNVHVENNKLLIRGQAPSDAVKNQIWDQIKLVDASFSNDLVVDISVDPNAAPAAAAGGVAGGKTYTVKAGDSLSKIAQQFYGDASAYTKIFNANKDKLTDPDKIFPGQELVIPG